MKFSLLSRSGTPGNVCTAINDLSLPATFTKILGAQKSTEYFLSVISRPLHNIEDIEYRRSVISDLTENPNLLSKLKTVFNRYDAMKSDWLELRSGAAASGGTNAEAELDAAWASLKVTALFPNTLVSFFTNIRDALNGAKLSSSALCDIRDYCTEMLEGEVLGEIADIAEAFRYNNADDYRFTMNVSLGQALEVTGCEVVEVLDKLTEKKTLRSILTHRKQSVLPFEGGEGSEDAKRLLAAALSDADRALSSITNSIYETFYGISSELSFYECALKYIEYLHANRLGCTLPRILPAKESFADITGLRDLYLSANGMSAADIVPGDIRLSHDNEGMLIRGENGAGKTTFLRSFGSAQILCQAGLPIPAEKAELSLRTDIFTHFSAAEEKFTEGDTTGRFEGEARAVSKIISALQPYSLVLFNETFQTTAFAEGTHAMVDILSILPRCAVQYIFVTHLTGLFDHVSNKVIKCRFDENEHKYSIIS